MTLENRVLWSEGMFLRPQHMQQQDRYYDRLYRAHTRLLNRNFWGVSCLEIDRQLLDMGTLAIKHCEGIFPDGTVFAIDSGEGDRLLLQANETIQNAKVYLALPISFSGSDEVDLENSSTSLTRFTRAPLDIKDSNQGQNKIAKVDTVKLRLQLLTEDQLTPDYTVIELLRVREVNGDGRIVLDESHVAPMLNISVNDNVVNILKETIGLLRHRSEAIAGRLTSERAGTSEVADFMLLQMVNRYDAHLSHLQASSNVHPEEVFRWLLALAAEISTFSQKEKRLNSLPVYDHNDLRASFQILMGEIRQSLSMVFEQSAIQIPLQERRYGVRVAPISDRKLLDNASFVMGVKTQWNKEIVATKMPTIVKAGGVEQLRDLVNLQLPGIQLEPLTVAPRQIPYHSGYTYFQLEKTPENWSHLEKSGGLAFHFSGEVPGLELELWAVKE